MSMRLWVRLWVWRMAWLLMVWACMAWVAGYGRGAWGACVGGRSPMAMAGGGGEWGPHTKESIKCIPQSGAPKNQKTNLEL